MTPSSPGSRLTPSGGVWLLITFVLLVVGMARGINLLALLGCVMLAVAALQAVSVGRGLRNLTARRWVDDVVREGRPCRVEVRVSCGAGGWAARGVWVEDAGDSHLLGWYLERVGPGERYTCRGEVVPPRRGPYQFAPVLVGTGYPFGLLRRGVVVGEPLTVLVLPRTGKLSRERLRRHLRGSDPRGERSRQQGARHELARVDFHGLRPYRAGDSLRWVHWRTSARRGQLMVKEFEDVPGDDLVLVFDAAFPEGEAFEDAVSLAATIVQEWCQRRGDRLVLAVSGEEAVVVDGLTGPELSRRALEALAVVRSEPVHDRGLAASLRPYVPRTAAVVVVAAGDSELPALLEAGLGRRVALLDASRPEELGLYQCEGGRQ